MRQNKYRVDYNALLLRIHHAVAVRDFQTAVHPESIRLAGERLAWVHSELSRKPVLCAGCGAERETHAHLCRWCG